MLNSKRNTVVFQDDKILIVKKGSYYEIQTKTGFVLNYFDSKLISTNIKHFFEQFAPFVILNMLEEVAKPITLAFRLFGNILAGEILIIILAQLLPMWFPIPNIIWLGFSVFVGVIQAFIFTMLSMSYLANGVKEDQHD